MVVSYGRGPDVDQRKRVSAIIGSMPALTVVMTSSALARGITSALTFFNRRMQAADLNDFEKASAHLELSTGDRANARRLRSELERELNLNVPA